MFILQRCTSCSNGTTSLVDTRRPAIITEALIEYVHWFFPDQQHQQETICKLAICIYYPPGNCLFLLFKLLHPGAALTLGPGRFVVYLLSYMHVCILGVIEICVVVI